MIVVDHPIRSTSNSSRSKKKVFHSFVVHLVIGCRPPPSLLKMSEVSPLTLHTASTASEVTECLNRGEDVDGLDENEYTPLISAIERGNKAVFDILLEKGASVTKTIPDRLWEPIQFAAVDGQADMVEELVRKGANPNLKSGGTPLVQASLRGFMDVVNRLLDLGADPNLRQGNVPPLAWAVSRGKVDVVGRLLEAGARVNDLFHNNSSAFLWACSEGHVQIGDRLLIYGADIFHCNSDGENGLIKASAKGHFETVDRLLGLGLDPNSKDLKGNTALMRASEHGSVECVKLLLAHNADRSISNSNGFKALDLTLSDEIKHILCA